MANQEILQRVNRILCEEFELEPEELHAGATLYTDLGLDSLDAVDMIVALEKEFGMKLTTEQEMKEIRTLGDLHQLILNLQAQNTTQASR